MILSLWRGSIGAFAGALLGLTALVLGYARNPSLTFEMDRGASGVLTGFYDSERAGRETFAWTRRSATLTLRDLDRSVDWSCTIRLRGGRADEATLPQVLVSVDGMLAATAGTTNHYQDLTVTVPAKPRSSGVSVTLTSSDTFVPGPGDKRALGVMVDRWTCAPLSAGLVHPPREAMIAAAAGGAAFGAAFALLGAGVWVALGAIALLVTAQAIPLAWELGAFTSYTQRAIWLALAIAGLLVVAVRAIERVTGRPSSGAARLAGGVTAVALYLKLLALLHPSKLPIDVIFHAHRLEWVLDGRLYFTQPMPSGVRFPYAIGLYVFSAPWSLLTNDFVLLLRIVVSAAEAIGALLVYVLVSRLWRDRVAAVAAATLFHLVPRTFEIVGNANMTNAFGQSLAFAALAAAVLWPLQRGQWPQAAALTVITAWALLSHISTFTLLGAILLTLAALYWFTRLRAQAVSVFVALAVAAGLSVLLYYGHFGDAYRSAARVRASNAAAAAAPEPGSAGSSTSPAPPGEASVALSSKLAEAGRLTVAAVGWPIFILGLSGIVPFWRRRLEDRLSLAILALLITYVVFVLSVVFMPVERSFQRYAAEFISRVTLATYPAMVILAGLGVASAWRASAPARLAAGALMVAATYVGVITWIEWLR